ncbi:MAG: thioredoxin [Vicinamibacteria bacterium]
MSDKVLELNDANWASEVMGSREPVLIDFWAGWCVPCRTLSPIVESIASELAGRLKVGKLDVQENENVPMQYDVRTLPTLLLIKGGQVVEQRVGLLTRDNLVKLLTPHLA